MLAQPPQEMLVEEAPLGDADDVRSAVEAADEAFADWSSRSPRERGKILFFAAEEVRRRNAELGALLTTEQGKPIREAVDEVNGFANILEYYYALSAGAGESMVLPEPCHFLVQGARSALWCDHPGTWRRSSWVGRAALVAGITMI